MAEPYLIKRHGGWFRPNAQGYTRTLADAGLYSETRARSYLDVEGLTIHPASALVAKAREEIAQHEAAVAALRDFIDRVEPTALAGSAAP